MRVTQLGAGEVARRAVDALGLDSTATASRSPEALCGSLRRAASFLCPATPRQLVDAVHDVLSPLEPDGRPSVDDIEDQLDLLVAIGDLLELRDEQSSARHIYLGPPSFLVVSPGRYLLLGVRPSGAPLVDSSLTSDIVHAGHTRTLTLDAGAGPTRLTAAGLHEIQRSQWLHSPAPLRAEQLLADLATRLSAAGPAGQVADLQVLDPATPIRFYRGRWRDPRLGDTGDFVARRPQAYGADLWCIVRISDGQPVALLDLPLDPTGLGRDEAWRAQSAIDANRGTPQRFRVTPPTAPSEASRLEFFAPLPTWAQRYLELIGTPLSRTSGALLASHVPAEATVEVEQFLADMLWMTSMTGEATT